MKQEPSKTYKIFITIHLIGLVVWFIIAFASAGHIKDRYAHLFGTYLNYSVFSSVVFLYMIAGNLLVAWLYQKMKIWGLIVFEIPLIVLIVLYYKIYVS